MGIFEIPLEENDITAFIPQRNPFVMVDRIISSDEKETVTSFTVKEDNIFCINGMFLEPGLIENIAQSAAARAGFIAASLGEKPVLGFIGAIQNFAADFMPKVGESLTTRIKVDYEVMNALLISAEVNCRERKACECKLKIFLQNN